MLTEKGAERAGKGYDNKNQMDNNFQFCSILPSTSNIAIKNYFSYKPRFNGVYSRDKLPRRKKRAYVINIDKRRSHWVSLFINTNKVVQFDSLGIEYTPQNALKKQKIIKKINHSKNI